MRLSVEGAANKIEIWKSDKSALFDMNEPLAPTSNLTLWVKGVEVSSAVRDITLVLTHDVTNFKDKINLTVVEADLDITGVPDADEEDPGGFVAVNDDDDNENGNPDKDDAPPVANEDDLVKLEFRLLPESLPVDAFHHVRLEALQGGGLIKTYHYSDKSGTPMGPLPFCFVSREALADSIWVEGFVGSSSLRDVELKMTYEYDGRDVADDRVRLTVIDVDITSPVGSLDGGRNPGSSWRNSPCYHFDFQGVVSGSPGTYPLTVSGTIAPSAPFTYQWSLDSTCGTLSSTTVASPTHTEPSAAGEGILQLQAMYNGSPTGILERRRVEVYEDHLARDYVTFGTGGSCSSVWAVTTFHVDPQPTMGTWNCHGSVKHAYDGSGNGYSGTTVGWTQTSYSNPSAADWATIGTSLGRGDVVSFWSGAPGSYTLQHSHTCRGSSSNMFGANNEPSVNFDNSPPATWKWYECTSKQYYDAVNSASQAKWGVDFLTLVIVHQKP